MAIYVGSRYEGEALSIDKNNIKHISPRRSFIKPHETDYVVQFKEGDRLDIVAKNFYGDSQLAWVVLDANPQYYKEEEIQIGDYLNVPRPERIGR